jgi:hypothetical protein
MVGDADSRHSNRVGGTALAFRRIDKTLFALEFFIIVIIVLCVWLMREALEFKKNYTDLHSRVHKIEYLHDGMEWDKHE